MNFLTVRMPIEVFKLTHLTFFIVINNRNLFHSLKLCVQSPPYYVALLLGELHVHYFEVDLRQEESVW